MELIHCDTLIIGAGPAGSALGFLLRREDVDTLLVEACDVATKDKLCGGVLTPEAIDLCSDIYGADELNKLNPFVPTGLELRAFDTSLRKKVNYRVLPRSRFDAYCLGRYVAQRGRFLDCTRLIAVDTEERLATVFDARTHCECRIQYQNIVGADGATSTLRRLISGIKPRVTAALQADVACIGSDVIADIMPADEGVCWYIPDGAHAVLGGFFHHAEVAYCRKRIAGFCDSLGLELSHLRGAPLPTGDDICLCTGLHTWFVGDAAGLIDVYTGSGIHYALASAQALATAMLGSASYEKTMTPIVDKVSQGFKNEPTANLRACLNIVQASRQMRAPHIPESR